MNKEEIIKDFINYLNQDIQYKDFLTYQEQDEWKDYINRIIDNQVKEKDKEIQRLNNENNQYKEYIKELKDSLRSYHIKNNKLINKNKKLNNIINEIEAIIYNINLTGIEARIEIQERLDKLQALKEGK